MKVVFGMVSLLIALALVGFLAARQLKTAAAPVAPGGSAAAGLSTSGTATTGTVREQSQQIQQKVKDDVSKALGQGMTPRQDATEQ